MLLGLQVEQKMAAAGELYIWPNKEHLTMKYTINAQGTP
jgi:hypothetical protein